MANRSWVLTAVAAVLSVQTAAWTWAEDISFQDLGARLGWAAGGRQQGFSEYRGAVRPPADYRRAGANSPRPAGVLPTLPNRAQPFRTGDERGRQAGPPPATSSYAPPRTIPQGHPRWSGNSFAGAVPASGRPGDGLPRASDRDAPAEGPPVRRGTVHGRLIDKGRPLVNCRVVIVPMQKDGKHYTVDGAGQPLTTTTDERGVYSFENVPAGAYKMTWLPDGTRQWIRRISLEPDVRVREDQVVALKDIRIALHTIN